MTILSFTDFCGTALRKALFYGRFERLKFNLIWILTESKGRVLNSFFGIFIGNLDFWKTPSLPTKRR